ncbi:MAG TPA: NAD(P)/FAD-dependent oxidoreductase [Actinomycetota bacterium]|nr:NAD(P)/FAD-dependent oxidoreductase [Actinomycetota bacterium]
MDRDPSESWDVVVVGSGPGGLTAAACLASAGRRVLVLEAHDLAGGNTQVFRRNHKVEGDRRDDYEFDVGVHYIGDCGPGGLFPSIFASLGVGDRIVFRPLDPDGFDTLEFPDLTFVVPAGWDRYQERLVEAFPDERAGIERVVATLRTVAEEGRSRAIPGVDTPTFDEWAFRPLSELFAEGELSQRARAVLDHWSGLYAGAPSQTAIAMHAGIIDHYMRGAYYPEGGGQMIPARLVQVIEAHGGEVRTLTPVRRIVVEGGRAVGVELEDGTTIGADLVVSNADHTRTVFGLVGEEHWDPATVRWTREATMTLGLICVYLVLDVDLTDGPNTNYFVFPTYESEEMYAGLDRGEIDPETGVFAYVAMASRKDPDNPHLCPSGQTNLQIMTLAPRGLDWWGVEVSPADGGRYRRNQGYLERKQAITEALLDAGDRVLDGQLGAGSLRDHIVFMETATPVTHERYTRSTGGTSYGYVHSPEQSGMHRPAYRTEIEGLWIVGANTVSGHGVAGAMVGGVNCAGEILGRPLLVEMVLGTALGDPADVPADPADFDPVEWCRGARLRAKRAAGRAARGTGIGESVGSIT